MRGFKTIAILFLIIIFLSTSLTNSFRLFNKSARNMIKNKIDKRNESEEKESTEFDMIKSELDKKKYHSFKLKSNLEVIVIIDDKSKASAVGMTINSGSNKEDSDIRGLAHFCEHLLFLGSEKFPEPTEFFDFVTRNSGKFNGFTDYENTAFFFQIKDDKFEEGLNIFANNFISPLLSEKFIGKEVNSINSEFEKNLQNDSKRKDSVLREISNEKSLFHRFTTGSKKTLSEDPKKANINIKTRIENYFKRNYTPENMKLIIYGDKPVQDYKNMVEKIFEGLNPSSGAEITYSADMSKYPWEYNHIGKLVLYQTINTHQDFEINIMIDDVYESMPNNAALYFKTLFNYRGEGSIFDILRGKGLMKSIKSHAKKVYKGVSFFSISGLITDEGIKNLDSVIAYIYAYIHKLKQLSLDQKLYDYIKQSQYIGFNYKAGNKHNILAFIKNLSRSVWKYKKEYYVAQHKLLIDYNKEALTKFYDKITLQNSVIVIGNNLFDKNMIGKYSFFVENFPEVSGDETIFSKSNEFYKTKYCDFNLTSEFIQKIENTQTNPVSQEISTKFPSFTQMNHLPKEHLSLEGTCPELSDKTKKSNLKKTDEEDLAPALLCQDAHEELFYKQDKSFFVAKTNLFIKFIFPGNVNDPKYATLMRLLVYAINHALRNSMFMETLNQNSFRIKGVPNGFIVEIYSFTEIISQLSVNFFQNLRNLSLKEEGLSLIKDEIKQQLRTKLNLAPAAKAYLDFINLMSKDYVDSKTIINEVDKITLNDFNTFFNDLFNALFLRGFVHGTLSEDESKKLFTQIKNLFLNNTSRVIDERSKNHLDEHANFSGYYIYREKMKDKQNVIHAVANFYQIGTYNLDNLIYSNLIKELCGNIYFTELRTNHQLGYTAKGKIVHEGDMLYYLIYVQGSVKTPDLMDHHIEDVVEKMKGIIQKANENKFKSALSNVIEKLGKNDTAFKHRTVRIWNEIDSMRYNYNLKQLALEEEKNINQESLMEFFDKFFVEDLKKVSVQIYSSQSENISGEMKTLRSKYPPVLIDDLNYFRKNESNFFHSSSNSSKNNNNSNNKNNSNTRN